MKLKHIMVENLNESSIVNVGSRGAIGLDLSTPRHQVRVGFHGYAPAEGFYRLLKDIAAVINENGDLDTSEGTP